MRRREALQHVLSAAALPLLPLLPQEGTQGGDAAEPQSQSAAPDLYDPSRVGRARPRVTDYENDPFIIGVEERLRCTCGCNLDVYTCRTTDFTCGVSPEMHRQVVRLVEEGKTADEILDAFVAQHGEMVLMAPKKEGFNLAAYFVPGVAISMVGATLVWVLSRRRQVALVTSSTMLDDEDLSGLSADEHAKLEQELDKLES
ncbi:MAG: cytochrome c-type biogenesis protein CcmH [Gemmatimonadota bacterium]|nr:cytochrome c-type biogenesis protein CcmH [Gemmatimonadota bacterium]